MNKYLLVILFIVISIKSNSQIIDNKVNLYFSAGIFNSLGEKDVIEDNYITPSLYANYENGYNIKLKGSYKLFSFLSLGLQYKKTMFSQWNYVEDSSTLYSNSSSKIISFAPIIQVHNKFKDQGFFNRSKIYVELKPVFGQSTLNLDKPIFDIQSNTGIEITAPTTSSNFIWGAEVSAGVDVTVHRNIGLFADFGFNYYKVDSQFYNDKYFNSLSFEFGLYIRLFKNKHFYY